MFINLINWFAILFIIALFCKSLEHFGHFALNSYNRGKPKWRSEFLRLSAMDQLFKELALGVFVEDL